MKLQTLILLTMLIAMTWWVFRARLIFFKARLGRSVRVAALAYMAIIAVRLVTSPVDQEQLRVAGLSLAFFGALWVVVWVITQAMHHPR